jgi:hypothetical protein
MAKDIVVTCVVSENCGSSRKVARALGEDHRNIKKGSERRFDLNIRQESSTHRCTTKCCCAACGGLVDNGDNHFTKLEGHHQ